ncbi:hypothetical protein [Sunxiuqinia sp. sy24]|uniref:hypothetical protein n=1 Tax=Sunxiuqinia sp. sy24 TaxID=3461495 RepID=UPI004045EA78
MVQTPDYWLTHDMNNSRMSHETLVEGNGLAHGFDVHLPPTNFQLYDNAHSLFPTYCYAYPYGKQNIPFEQLKTPRLYGKPCNW